MLKWILIVVAIVVLLPIVLRALGGRRTRL